MLRIDKLTMKFGGITAVKNFSMEMPERSIYAIIGPNGAGKSTIFNCISRFYEPDSGEIEFNGCDLRALKPEKVVSIGIARSFQNVELFEGMTVRENLLTGLHNSIEPTLWGVALQTRSARNSEKLAQARTEEMLEVLGLEDVADERVGELAYGFQKRVDIGRAIMSEPKLILLDEPVAGMNSAETAEIARLIRRLRDEWGFGVLLIEHDMTLVMNIAEQISVINFGIRIMQGTPDEVRAHPGVVEAYLGGS